MSEPVDQEQADGFAALVESSFLWPTALSIGAVRGSANDLGLLVVPSGDWEPPEAAWAMALGCIENCRWENRTKVEVATTMDPVDVADPERGWMRTWPR